MKLCSTLSLLSVVVPFTSAEIGEINLPPLPDFCFNDVSQISQLEIGCVFPARLGQPVDGNCTDIGNALTFAGTSWGEVSQIKRIYTVCPNTINEFGSDGSIPLVTINPNMEVRCGETGESSNNCVFSGGIVQFLTPHPADLAEAQPELPVRDLMQFFDTSNLLVRGFTFQGVVDDEENDVLATAIQFALPGQNIVFSDNIIKENEGGFVIGVNTVDEIYDSTGETPYQSITFEDTLFDSNKGSVVIGPIAGEKEGFANPSGYDKNANEVMITNSYFTNNKMKFEIFSTCCNIIGYGLDNVCIVDNQSRFIIATNNTQNLLSVTDLFLEDNKQVIRKFRGVDARLRNPEKDCPLLDGDCTCEDLPTVDMCSVTKQPAGRALYPKLSYSKSSSTSTKSSKGKSYKSSKGQNCDIILKSSKSSKSNKKSR